MANHADAVWAEKGASLSDKSAMKEFGLTRDEIIEAINAGKLQFREQSIYGNPWFRLLRREVEALVANKRGRSFAKRQKATWELTQVEKELRALRQRTVRLERRRQQLPGLLKG